MSSISSRLSLLPRRPGKAFLKLLAPTVKTTCADSLGKRICRDFDLDINEILWIEHFPGEPQRMYVATFTPKSYFGTETYYAIDWRPIRSNELEAIKLFIPECDPDQ